MQKEPEAVPTKKSRIINRSVDAVVPLVRQPGGSPARWFASPVVRQPGQTLYRQPGGSPAGIIRPSHSVASWDFINLTWTIVD